jgi:hypothetical protein
VPAGTGGALSACRELGALGATSTIYTLPADSYLDSLDPDGEGLLLSLELNRAVRVVAIQPDGSTSQLLGETEYTRQWSFNPVRVIAMRTSGVLDLLVSDDADVELVRKDGSTVTWFGLAWTNNMDLTAQALGTAGENRIAGFTRGTDPETLALVDIDAVTKNGPKGTDLSDAVNQWVKNARSSRDFGAPGNFNAAPSPTGLWLTAERLDTVTECAATGSTVACGAGASIETYDCNWHLDAWHLSSAPSLASPTATLDARMRITPACTDVNIRDLGHADLAFRQRGVSRNHAIAVDPVTSRLAIAMDEYLGARNWDIRVLLLDPSGDRVLDVTVPSDNPMYWSSAWLYTRSDRVWLCYGTKCVVIDATGTTDFAIADPPFSVEAVMAQSNGLMLVGEDPYTAGAPIVGAVLSCLAH